MFTALVAGLYQFTVQLCVSKGRSIYCEITKNGCALHRSLIYESGSYQCCNGEAVDVLTKGDIISIRVTPGFSPTIYKNQEVALNTFSGFLLRETE